VGGERDPSSSMSCAAIFASPAIWGFETNDEPSEYRRSTTQLWISCLGGFGRRRIVLNKDGSFQRTAKFRGPD